MGKIIDMYDSKLCQAFLSLNKKEHRQFKKWLQSPLHVSHEEVRRIFDFFYSRNQLSPFSLQKPKLWKYLFGAKAYDDDRLRSLIHLSWEALRDFVGFFRASEDEFLHQFHLSQSLLDKELEPLANKSIQKMQQILSTSSFEDANFFQRSFQLEVVKFERSGTQKRTESNNLEQLFESAAYHFMYQILRYACNARSHSNISSISYQIPLLDGVLNWINAHEDTCPPSLLIYYYTYHSLLQYEEVTFDKLKQAFFDHFELLPPAERQEVLLMTINVCIKGLNTGQAHFAKEAFELYQKGLSSEMLFNKGVLSRFDYKNIVSIGLILREFSWVADFIERYTPVLEEQFRATYRDFNLAKLAFTQGSYGKAKRLFIGVEYDDVFFNLSAKMMLLKIYYEEKELDSLEALLESFNRYLQRHSSLGYHKEVYQNILALVRRILKLPPGDNLAIENLRQSIKETQPLADRKWLLAQLPAIGS